MIKHKQKRKNAIKNLNDKRVINIALAGNANVGKSVIFNQLTGLSQTIGNWPGKTVELKEGHLDFLGYRFDIVDLPGIYSLSTYSLEEILSREYIVSDKVDVIINVIDATNLERNLFFTFQLLELKVPIILAINQMDILRKRNMELDFKKLEEYFKLPVIPVVAIRGIGVHQLVEEAIELYVYNRPHFHYIEGGKKLHENLTHHHYHNHHRHHFKNSKNEKEKTLKGKENFLFPDLSSILSYGKEVETKIKYLEKEIENSKDVPFNCNYPERFLAIKLLENDGEIIKLFNTSQRSKSVIKLAEKFRTELENYHGEEITTITSSEIYNNIRQIIEKVIISKPSGKRKTNFAAILDNLTTHSFWGYLILILVLIGAYLFTFLIGGFLGGLIENAFDIWSEKVFSIYGTDNFLISVFWYGAMGGFFGALGGVLVYVIPFFLIIEILQDSGYLPRAAFLMDRFMHSLGVHGKTIIPMILGFGCNVPACTGCRIMETEREKKISIALTSLVPCAAVMVVVLGLVGRYLGIGWVIILFGINFIVIIFVGKVLNKIMPGECTELIMEMHEFRVPNYSVIIKQTWVRSKEFIYKSMPIIIVIGIILELLLIFRVLDPINEIFAPVTVIWLGLPVITGIFLVYGILRKELTLILLEVLASSMSIPLLELLNPIQMIVFCAVTMLYIPCFVTIVIIARETNWKYALQISILEIGLALLIGGIINWSFVLFSNL